MVPYTNIKYSLGFPSLSHTKLNRRRAYSSLPHSFLLVVELVFRDPRLNFAAFEPQGSFDIEEIIMKTTTIPHLVAIFGYK